MISKNDAYRGCLLGLAIGDAMGYPVDTKTWQQIQEDYGPYGLMGYDLRNGYAEISSHTQLAAFSCNGMLLGASRGHYDRYIRYIAFVHSAAWHYYDPVTGSLYQFCKKTYPFHCGRSAARCEYPDASQVNYILESLYRIR